jgi:dGTP triphosphohydrolase
MHVECPSADPARTDPQEVAEDIVEAAAEAHRHDAGDPPGGHLGNVAHAEWAS